MLKSVKLFTLSKKDMYYAMMYQHYMNKTVKCNSHGDYNGAYQNLNKVDEYMKKRDKVKSEILKVVL